MTQNEQDIQKTLDDMSRSLTRLQPLASPKTPKESSHSIIESGRFKFIAAIIGLTVVVVLIIIYNMRLNSHEVKMEAPPGNKIIYPKNGPPRLEKPIL